MNFNILKIGLLYVGGGGGRGHKLASSIQTHIAILQDTSH